MLRRRVLNPTSQRNAGIIFVGGTTHDVQKRYKLHNMSPEQLEYYKRMITNQDAHRPAVEVAKEKKRLIESRSLPVLRPGLDGVGVVKPEDAKHLQKRGTQFFEQSDWLGSNMGKVRAPDAIDVPTPNEPTGHSDFVKGGKEYNTAFGSFEMRPPNTGSLADAQYEGFNRQPPSWVTVGPIESGSQIPPLHIGHHPTHDYSHTSGLKDGDTSHMTMVHHTTDLKANVHALYRNSLKSLALMKHYYMLLCSIDEMKKNLRVKFERNAHLRDPEAIRHVLYQGWSDFNDTITYRKQRDHVFFFFGAQNKRN